ncbi:MAG: phosphoribosylformylglycinamidine synthase [Candidatus Aenigmarchaeota archaeon]|nr:phosphoribosylformylglycinamidine synthase [Candidatus Aenigmarchaeota archaeon]
MAVRIEVSDATSKRVRDADVLTADVYTLDGINETEAQKLGRELFTDPVMQRFSLTPLGNDFDWDYAVEIGFWPGVTDNVGNTASSAMADVIGKNHPVYTSRLYFVKGVSEEEAAGIAGGHHLYNPLIHRMHVKKRSEWIPREGMGIYLPVVRLTEAPVIEYIDLGVSGEGLMQISRERNLALDLEFMRAIQAHRDIYTDAEIESLAQTWSEHCKHNIFRAVIEYEENGAVETINSLFATYIRGATDELQRRGLDWLVSVFSDNAGIVKFDNEFHVADKAETHNSPSALDPYGGAITGVNGVARDTMAAGLGAREIARADIFCFAPPDYSGPLPPRIFHPRRTFTGVRSGVRDGGNKCGIPTVNGSIRFDSYPHGSVVETLSGKETIISYMGKPLVYVRSEGIMPAQINGRPTHVKKADGGNKIILVGGRTGKDGIHGATFSSEALHKGSPATAVQLDEPIVQKNEFDFLLAARDRGLYKSIGDNGAGGLSCSVGEMAKESGGARLYLDKVPLKYAGMKPWEILLSESQNRMTLAVHPSKIDEFRSLARRYGVEATVIGEFTDTGYFEVTFDRRLATKLEMDFLHNGVPKKRLRAKWQQPCYEEPDFPEPDIDYALLEILGRHNIASKESTVRMYDHEVQAQTVVKPFTGAANDGPSDAAVIWPLEMQRKMSFRGLVVAHGINANYGLVDTYHMAASNIDEAIRNAVAAGATPERIWLLDNFCWSSSDDAYRLAQLVRAGKACHDYSVAFGTPFISGKDSMFNDYFDKETGIRISVPPTLLISSGGVIPDIRKAVTMDAKRPGNLVYVVGGTYPELGGSEYFAMMGSRKGEAWIGNNIPKVDAAKARKTYRALNQAISRGYVASCHDCSDGGLGVALAEMAFAGGYGMRVYLDNIAGAIPRNDYVLFSESNSRFVVEVPEQRAQRFESVLGRNARLIGYVGGNNLEIYSGNKNIAYLPVHELKEAWQKTLRW